MDDTRYSIVISLFDHNSALSLPRTTSPSALLPNTSTGLPQAVENALRVQASKLVLPSNFWKLPATSPLPSQPPTSNRETLESSDEARGSSGIGGSRTTNSTSTTNGLGISSENRGDYIPAIRTSQLYVPSREQIVEKQVAQLDFRFGPLFADWIDRPAMTTTKQMDSTIASTSTLPDTHTIGSQDKSGSVALNFGIIHLYREAGVSPAPSTPTEKERALVEDDGTIVAVILVPGNISVARFLEFVSPALDGVMQLRMLRDSSPNRNLVVMRFRSRGEADQFRRMFMGKPFDDGKDVSLFSRSLTCSLTYRRY